MQQNITGNAALYYRKTAEFMRSNPGFDEEAIKWALEQAKRIDKISESDAEQTHCRAKINPKPWNWKKFHEIG